MSETCSRSSAHPDRRVEVWFQDESRFGQQGTLTSVWASKGSRPERPKQTDYEWVYLYGAANPETGESVALILPWVSTELMQKHLEAISRKAGPNRHIVLVLDNAGWHTSHGLVVPENITLLPLPPYSPELNPMERLWSWIKQHYFSNRTYVDYDALLDSLCCMWSRIGRARLRSVCACSWLTPTD